MKRLLTILLLLATTYGYSQMPLNTWTIKYVQDEFEDPDYSLPTANYALYLEESAYSHLQLTITDNSPIGYKIFIRLFNRHTKEWVDPEYSPLKKFKISNELTGNFGSFTRTLYSDETTSWYSYKDFYTKDEFIATLEKAPKEVKLIISVEDDDEIVIAINAIGFTKILSKITKK